ncbi:MAG: hypothetical protein H7333_10505 [Bdellovibrionales bacterium]|nr:hypothetical protein [Oligoflexia bacterium]
MAKAKKADKVLTVQVHHENLNPRTFRVPLRWIRQASSLAWILLAISIISSVFAIREYLSERSARPELVSELENEVQELKIALEKKGDVSVAPVPAVVAEKPKGDAAIPANTAPVDTKASDTKPPPAPGEVADLKEGVWSGLAENISLPAAGAVAPLRLEDPKVEWQGKYANFTVNVVYRDPGKGSQQGHIVALGRSNDRIFAHPEGVLNVAGGAALFNPNRGEYFSVARFRVLKAHFGPFDSTKQLGEIQVFLFDLNNKLILTQAIKYGK